VPPAPSVVGPTGPELDLGKMLSIFDETALGGLDPDGREARGSFLVGIPNDDPALPIRGRPLQSGLPIIIAGGLTARAISENRARSQERSPKPI